MASKARDIADLGSNDVLETRATGVDVTGSLSTDGLTVDASSIGFGTAAPNSYPNLTTVTIDGTSGSVLDFEVAGVPKGQIYTSTNAVNYSAADTHTHVFTTTSLGTPRMRIANNGDVSFYEDTGTTAKMVWDASAESLGIGTASPSATGLHISKDNANAELQLTRTGIYPGNFKIFSGGDSTNRLVFWDMDASANRMTIDSAGNVGIGTDSPILAGGSYTGLNIDGTGASLTLTNSYGQTSYIYTGTTTGELSFECPAEIRFRAGGTERARIDSSGNLLVGTTTSSSKWVAGNGVDMGFEARGAGIIVSHASYENQLLNTDNITAHIRFYYRGSATGSINTSGSGTVYATTSDYRLKENVVTMDSASDRVKALKPCRFNFIADPDTTVDGFLAHEAQEVVPEAVTGTKDAMDEDGNPEYQGIDQSKLVPLLTKALQEAITKIEQLETRIETLENN